MKLNRKQFLSFRKGNAKLHKKIYTFSLPAGWSCPFAKLCLSKADPETGKIQDGKETLFRCFAASMEARNPFVRKNRWHNFNLLKGKTIEQMTQLILDSLPKDAELIRIHVSGDYFNKNYFQAWMNVAEARPDILFYGYTKATPFLSEYKGVLPKNLRFTASYGGTRDDLIRKNKLKSATVVYSVDEAKRMKLPIDHDDSYAIANKQSFSLLLHGTQPKGSAAGKAWAIIKKTVGGYKGNNDFGSKGITNKREQNVNEIVAN